MINAFPAGSAAKLTHAPSVHGAFPVGRLVVGILTYPVAPSNATLAFSS